MKKLEYNTITAICEKTAGSVIKTNPTSSTIKEITFCSNLKCKRPGSQIVSYTSITYQTSNGCIEGLFKRQVINTKIKL